MMRLIDADDLISRQAAINESYKVTIDGETFDVVQVETLLGLPTAERKGHWIGISCAMDLIDRQGTIDALYSLCDRMCPYSKKQRATMCRTCVLGSAVDVIDELPTAERKGHWIDDNGLYRCSACGHLWSELWWSANCPIETMIKIMPYCPKCGARMEV